MRSTILAAALLVAAALSLAACGADPSPSAASDHEKMHQAALKFAACMRAQGVDFPDPVPDSAGRTTFRVGGTKGAGKVTPDKMNTAERACAKYRDAMKPRQMSEADQQRFKDAALAHARCMREHGLDFPDPQFSEGGGATMRLGGGVNPEDPKFKAAEKACGGSAMPAMRAQP